MGMRMFKAQLYTDLIEKIPNNSRLIMFGACYVALKMIEDIKQHRPNCKILGFIDNYRTEKTFYDLPIWSLKEFLKKDLQYDFVVMSTRNDVYILYSIFSTYKIPFIYQTEFVSKYYRSNFDNDNKLNEENFNTVINMFKEQEDKDLYELIFRIRCASKSREEFMKYYDNKFSLPRECWSPITYQYLEKINKNAVTKIIDAGLNNGLNEVAYNKLLPNLKQVYGFEVLYDRIKLPFIDDIIKNKLVVVPYCLGEKEGYTEFWLNKVNTGASYCVNMTERLEPTDRTKFEKLNVPITTIDKYCKENNIKYDFLKMDIEGAELSALKGGIETIKKYRPQLAISIYHSTNDFIDIPQYLNNILENYTFRLGHYSYGISETVLYAIPNELE